MATPADAQHLAKIRTRHGDASAEWSLDRTGEHLCAILYKGTESVEVAGFTVDCDYTDRDFLLHAHADIAFLLRLLKDAFAEIRRLKPQESPQAADRRWREAKREEEERSKDYAAECAMKCNDRLFRAFLVDRYHVPDVADAERIAVSVRNILRVKSRGELNTDSDARRRWIDFRSDFEAWRTHA